jgi:hypothetical protein
VRRTIPLFTAVLVGLLAVLSSSARAGGAEGSPPSFAFEQHLLVPVRVHLLRAKDSPALNCGLTAADVERVFGKVNRLIWAQAGLQMLVESVVDEAARGQALYEGLGANRTEQHLLLARPRASTEPDLIHVYYVHTMGPNGICFGPEGIFVKDTARLNPVPAGIDEPLPRVTAHEIGHALSLPHRQDTFNLMQSGTNGYLLNADEIAQARAAAEKRTSTLTVEKALAEAHAAFEAKQWPRARSLYMALRAVPVPPPASARIEERLKAIPEG